MPFDLAFGPLADERFPAIRDAVARAGIDPSDRDAFLMQQPVVMLLRDLRPDAGLGEGMDQMVAMVHHGWLFWAAGQPVGRLDRAGLESLLAADGASPDDSGRGAWYLQLPERRLWAQALEGEAHEPVDGCFIHRAPGEALRVLAVLGVHPDRDGFTVVETSGPRPAAWRRPDHSPAFSPLLPGGAAAALRSIAGAPELLELGWRALTVPLPTVEAPA